MSESIPKKDLIALRKYQPDDYNFILATWLRGLYYGNDWFRKIPKQIYMTNYHKVIDSILRKPAITADLAVLKDDPETILGYSITEPEVLHWVFVKKAWRNIGLGKDLIPQNTKTVTHLTKYYKLDHEFNPFLL